MFMVYDFDNECVISNLSCCDRQEAIKWCEKLERIRDKEEGTYGPVHVVNGKLVGV